MQLHSSCSGRRHACHAVHTLFGEDGDSGLPLCQMLLRVCAEMSRQLKQHVEICLDTVTP
jgi:hypothetical protein